MLTTKLAHNNRQVLAGEAAQIRLDSTCVAIDFVHVYRENGISQAVSSKDTGSVITHCACPVLSPVSRIHHQHVRQTTGTQSSDSGDGVSGVG